MSLMQALETPGHNEFEPLHGIYRVYPERHCVDNKNQNFVDILRIIVKGTTAGQIRHNPLTKFSDVEEMKAAVGHLIEEVINDRPQPEASTLMELYNRHFESLAATHSKN